jgi:uncharacterized protein YecT (DUF1311 family)
MVMPDDLSRTIEADLGPILVPLASAQEQGATKDAGRAFRKVAAAGRRRRFGPTSVGAYTATALLGVTLGMLFAGARHMPAERGPAAMSEAVEQPAKLQVLVAAPVEPHHPEHPLPNGLASPPTEPAAQSNAPPELPAAPSVTIEPLTPAGGEPTLRVPQPAAPVAGPAPSRRATAFDPVPGATALAVAPARGGASPPEPAPEQACDQDCLAYQLDEAERALAAAYQEARRAGVPGRELRARGRAWAEDRSVAAAISGVAMLDAYQIEREALVRLTDAWRGRPVK